MFFGGGEVGGLFDAAGEEDECEDGEEYGHAAFNYEEILPVLRIMLIY